MNALLFVALVTGGVSIGVMALFFLFYRVTEFFVHMGPAKLELESQIRRLLDGEYSVRDSRIVAQKDEMVTTLAAMHACGDDTPQSKWIAVEVFVGNKTWESKVYNRTLWRRVDAAIDQHKEREAQKVQESADNKIIAVMKKTNS